MKKNIGGLDRILRAVAGIVIVFLYINDLLIETFAPALLVIGGVLILTSFFGVCPLYSIFGINTTVKSRRNKSDSKQHN